MLTTPLDDEDDDWKLGVDSVLVPERPRLGTLLDEEPVMVAEELGKYTRADEDGLGKVSKVPDELDSSLAEIDVIDEKEMSVEGDPFELRYVADEVGTTPDE